MRRRTWRLPLTYTSTTWCAALGALLVVQIVNAMPMHEQGLDHPSSRDVQQVLKQVQDTMSLRVGDAAPAGHADAAALQSASSVELGLGAAP